MWGTINEQKERGRGAVARLIRYLQTCPHSLLMGASSITHLFMGLQRFGHTTLLSSEYSLCFPFNLLKPKWETIPWPVETLLHCVWEWRSCYSCVFPHYFYIYLFLLHCPTSRLLTLMSFSYTVYSSIVDITPLYHGNFPTASPFNGVSVTTHCLSSRNNSLHYTCFRESEGQDDLLLFSITPCTILYYMYNCYLTISNMFYELRLRSCID